MGSPDSNKLIEYDKMHQNSRSGPRSKLRGLAIVVEKGTTEFVG